MTIIIIIIITNNNNNNNNGTATYIRTKQYPLTGLT
jgi:hypothetical protein